MFAAAAVAPVVATRLSTARQLQIAVVAIAIGLAAMTVAALTAKLPLFMVAGVIAGTGVGLQFRAAIAVAGLLSDPDKRGETLALAFLIAYVGLVVPVLMVGLALLEVSTATAFVGFAAAVGVLAVWTGLSLSCHDSHR